MSKPNQKKVMLYGLLLGSVVIGLLIDRLSGAGSATSPAAALADSAGASAVDLAFSQAEVKGPEIARIFTVNIRGAESRPAEAEPIRDAFNPTPRMRQFYADASPARKAEEARHAENDEELRRQELERFQSAHKLKGTSLREGGAWALIDSNIVRIGEQIDGYELRRIERYRVELTKGGLLATLSLPMP